MADLSRDNILPDDWDEGVGEGHAKLASTAHEGRVHIVIGTRQSNMGAALSEEEAESFIAGVQKSLDEVRREKSQ